MQGTGLRRFILAGLCLLASGGVAAAKEIRIGLANGQSADYAPTFAAEKLGYFKAAGLDVKLIAFRGGAPAQEALTAGAADIITYFGPAVALAISKGTKQKMVGTIAAGTNSSRHRRPSARVRAPCRAVLAPCRAVLAPCRAVRRPAQGCPHMCLMACRSSSCRSAGFVRSSDLRG
jgi:hypothetical protein